MTDSTQHACASCGRGIAVGAAFCPYCGSAATQPPDPVAAPPETSPSSAIAALLAPRVQDVPIPDEAGEAYEAVARAIVTRYRSAYRVGRSLKTVGGVLRFAALVALVVGGGGVLAAAAEMTRGFGGEAAAIGVAGVGGLFVTLITALLFVAGTVVAAQGETLRATLDTAVYASPFLTDAQRVQAMRLPSASR